MVRLGIFSARLAFDDAAPEPLERHGSTTRAGGGCTMKTSLKINHWGGGSARRGSPSGFAAPALHNLRGYSGRSPATMPLAIWSASVPHCVGRAPTLHHDGGAGYHGFAGGRADAAAELEKCGFLHLVRQRSTFTGRVGENPPQDLEDLCCTQSQGGRRCNIQRSAWSMCAQRCACSTVFAALCVERCEYSAVCEALCSQPCV